tara:strand:+ start:706 stop:1128 length:423 start_codon:yes stop_codon:yes gene_type:complete
MIYIASPFFNKEQVSFVESIEKALNAASIAHYSPRSEGILLNQTEEEKQKNKRHIYKININMISACSKVLAVIDDRDIGTIWEMGYATGKEIPVITISNSSYGLNVMLAESVQAHTIRIEDAIKAIKNNRFRGELLEGVY